MHPSRLAAWDGAQTAPSPGMALVPRLRQRLAESGLLVQLTITGAALPLATAADVAAYRVLQEALTNVIKHSAHPRAEVRIDHQESAVELTISNHDVAATRAAAWIGITGMQRRVAAAGGWLYVGPGAELHTFTVRAVIPRDPTEPNRTPNERPRGNNADDAPRPAGHGH